MKTRAPFDRAYDARMWWVMVAGCAARFSAERSAALAAGSGFILWVIIFAACWLVRDRVLKQPPYEAHARSVGNGIAVLGLLAFAIQFVDVGWLPALLTLLSVIQAAVFVVARRRLHAALLLAAALAGVLFAAAESRSSLFLVGAVWFTFAALALLVLDHRRERERAMCVRSAEAGSARTGAFAYAFAAFVCAMPLYLFAPKPTAWTINPATIGPGPTAQTQASRVSDGARSGTALIAPAQRAAVDAVGVGPDVMAPRPDIARPETGDYGDSFAIQAVQRNRARSNTIVLYVRSTRLLNLRGLVYDRFQDDRWHRDPQPFADLALASGQLDVKSPPLGMDSVQQSVEVVRELDTTLVHVPGIRTVRYSGDRLRRYADDVFVAPQPLIAGTVYSLESRLDVSDGRYSLAHRSREDLSRYLDAGPVSDRLRALARDVTQGSRDRRSQALALESFLRTEYRYSYETIEQQGYTPLDWFLFEGKQGHCEFFASALAVMLRTIDIPSRLATGFSLDAPNPLTGYHEVRALDGHAWVEAYIDGRWLMLEPTPFYPLPRVADDKQVADQLDRYLDRLSQANELRDPQGARARAARAARAAWHETRSVMSAVGRVPRELGWILPASIALGALASLAAYLAIVAAVDWFENRDLQRRLERAATRDARQATLITAQALLAALASRGRERPPGMSLREHFAALREAGIAVPAAFVDEFELARYGDDHSIREMRGASPSVASRAVRDITLERIALDRWPRVRKTSIDWHRRLRELLRMTRRVET